MTGAAFHFLAPDLPEENPFRAPGVAASDSEVAALADDWDGTLAAVASYEAKMRALALREGVPLSKRWHLAGKEARKLAERLSRCAHRMRENPAKWKNEATFGATLVARKALAESGAALSRYIVLAARGGR